MALIIPLRGHTPVIGADTFLAENATIIGDVTMGEKCSVWFGTVLRGDVNTITIGDRVNIQDGSVLHTLFRKSTITIGNDVSIGHNVTIHGADIHDLALVGMGAVVMDNAVVGEGGYRCRRRRGPVQYQDRSLRTVGRRSGKVYQEGRPRAKSRNQPKNRAQLPAVLPLVHPSRQT